jgi:protein-L-isoaspartate(D-aspartate) O-methyltransferase
MRERVPGNREGMLRDIEAEVRFTRQMIGRAAFAPRVMEAMGRVPRHEFVGEDLQGHAYDNGPLPIGCGQTISQPYIVALMTDLAELSEGDRVLEVGTGSGYQSAVLAELGVEVFSVEIILELGQEAGKRLERLGYGSVHTRIGDGYYGWKEEAPFDAILVTAAASEVPPPLIEQLKSGGRLVIPVGGAYMGQDLLLIEKGPAGKVVRRDVLPVAFVPLTGRH